MTWTDPRTWFAGERITAALLNLHVRDNFKAIGDPWTAYSPQWIATTTSPTNYTGTGEYKHVGRTVTFKARVTANPASFTAGTGLYRISLPTATADAIGARFLVAAWDSSANQHYMGTTYAVSSTDAPVGYVSSASGLLAAISPTLPFAFAANDYIEMTGTYEAAANP